MADKNRKPGEPPKPPSKKKWLEFAENKQFDPDHACQAYMRYFRRGWRFPNGDPILGEEHWLRILETWERNARNWNPDRFPGDDQ